MSIQKYFKRIRREEERRGKEERPQPVVSESAGTNSQSTEGEAAGPSVVEAAEGPSVVEAAAGPSVVEAAAGPSVVEAGADSKHRHSGWNPDWLKMPQFKNWLYLTQHGMFCRICRQHKPPVKKGPLKRAFIEVGILVFRKDYMDRHISSEPHQYSVKHQVSLASGYSVMQAFEPTVIMEHEAVISGFKCLYWLVDQRNNYQSHRIVDEMLEILAQIVELPILQEIRSSQAISLEVDETTDVSVSRQLDIHVRHLDKDGYVFNHFLDLVTLEDGKADSVVAAIKSVLQKKAPGRQALWTRDRWCSGDDRQSEWSGKAAHRQFSKAGFCSVCCSQTSTGMQRCLKCCQIYGKLQEPPAGTAPILQK
ncbi:Zinc finger MYM-type protein 1 [Dissostichus eleginoides]|uniref:Zinc finger MYM-type protein 1 n=1 Tax=Dissostichus eleginoides TaxID=100907 RepID=A0AAD9F1V9_DISEL|nr:Zinc finger MYM-type protein 1 [Dissostichus eleginoides]